MKKRFTSIRLTVLRALVGSFALLALLAFALPQGAQAATSGGSTIFNSVKVTYSSGSQTGLFAYANVSVTVNTVAALPTVTNPAGQTVVAGASVTYDYKIKSNSNGSDTYTTSALVNAPTNVSAASPSSITPSVTLWGGIALGSGAGTITVPFGTTTGLTAGTTTVQIGANTYTVTTITPGAAAYTDGSGNLVPEFSTTLTLTPIGASPAITAGSVAAGTQVGEFKNVAVTVVFTAGTPTTIGTDGSYSTTYTITTGALPTALNMTTTGVTTIVASPSVTITKAVSPTGTVTSGGTLTYTITVTNNHASASVNNVTVIDPVPAYTTYVSSSTRLNGITVAGDGATSPLVAGLLVDSNGSRAPGAAATGILAPAAVATVIFQVTVQ